MDVGSSFVYVTFITDCCKLSPDQGIHAASIGYPVNESDTTTVDNGGSGSGGTGGQQDDDLGAELLPSTPYLTGFDENVTRTMTVRNYKNTENTVDLSLDPRPVDTCQYFGVQSVTKGRVEDSGRIAVNSSGGFTTSGLIRVPPASAGLTGSSSEIPVRLRIAMPDESTFDRVKNANGTLSCRVTAKAAQGAVNDVVLKVQPQRNPFTGMFVRSNQLIQALIEALLDTFTTSEQMCFGENNTALLLNRTTECPESAQQTRQIPTPAGWAALLTGVGIGVAGLYRYYN